MIAQLAPLIPYKTQNKRKNEWMNDPFRKSRCHISRTIFMLKVIPKMRGFLILSYRCWRSSAHFWSTERGSLIVAGIVMWLRSLPTAFFRTVQMLNPLVRGLGAGNLDNITLC
jgi:hypothetical protein